MLYVLLCLTLLRIYLWLPSVMPKNPKARFIQIESYSLIGPSKLHLGHAIIAPNPTSPPGILIPALYSRGFNPQRGLLNISPHFLHLTCAMVFTSFGGLKDYRIMALKTLSAREYKWNIRLKP